MENVATGKSLCRCHAFSTDSTVVIVSGQLFSTHVFISGVESSSQYPIIAVSDHFVAKVVEDRLHLEEDDNVDEGEGEPMQNEDLEVVRQSGE